MAVSDFDTLMSGLPKELAASKEEGWDKFTLPKVKKWVADNLNGKRTRILAAALDCDVAQSETDPKPDEWVLKLTFTGRHVNYGEMGNRLLPISKDDEKDHSGGTEPMGEATFLFKCNEADARKWDAHGKTTPAPVVVEGDIVDVSFAPRLSGLFNEVFVGYNTLVRLDNVVVTPSNNLEPVALTIVEVQSFISGGIREPQESIIEAKRLETSGEYQLVFLKYRYKEAKQIKTELRSFPLVKSGGGYTSNNAIEQVIPCDDPPTETQITEAKANWPKSGQ